MAEHRHKQVKVSYDNLIVEVDEGLAPLLTVIWKHGIDTCLSCEENFPGIAWIMFDTAYDAEKFLNLVFVRNRKKPFWETMDGRITECGKDNWEYSVCVDNLSSKNPPFFIISISIRFPITDIPLIMKRLNRHEVR
jgi:hypothetical protein